MISSDDKTNENDTVEKDVNITVKTVKLQRHWAYFSIILLISTIIYFTIIPIISLTIALKRLSKECPIADLSFRLLFLINGIMSVPVLPLLCLTVICGNQNTKGLKKIYTSLINFVLLLLIVSILFCYLILGSIEIINIKNRQHASQKNSCRKTIYYSAWTIIIITYAQIGLITLYFIELFRRSCTYKTSNTNENSLTDI
ncbi:unnamed protein product [Didymodactylos carnosus]|uniref:Uncharacterized protein n=1 Tax=Didymodactylos carnosus TaxID=1234261 RepID=A0A815VYV8_9BILA|nr:unnamed protein product [Didymodactylos carnosus]CAF4399257.1 unnamed protein product [Didymodactylos carnosus]